MPISSARNVCSNQAESSQPADSSATAGSPSTRGRRRCPQRVQQQLRHRIRRRRASAGRLELGQMLGEQPPVHDRVGGAGRDPQIVLEHHPVPARSHTRSVPLTCARTGVAAQPAGRPESGCPVERLHLDDAVGDDRLLGVDVAQERVERPRPLPQTRPSGLPTRRRATTPRHQVDRKQLGPALTADPEGDVVGALLLFDAAFARAQRGHAQIGDGVQDLLVPRPRAAGRIDRFVVADRAPRSSGSYSRSGW